MNRFTPFSLNLRGRLFECNRPQVMGIINVTPDSFYTQSRTFDSSALIDRVSRMIEDGADMIDLGGYSSRPGAADIPVAEEIERIARGMEAIRKVSSDIPVSIDTFRAEVAAKAVTDLGADMINDISGGDMDDQMWTTVAGLRVPYIIMHMRGTPATMTSLTDYEDVTASVLADLGAKLNRLSLLGINDIIVDPGFGFAKTVEQNYELMAHLELFHILERPLLVGISRKSMIYKLLGITAEDALNGTTVLNTAALMQGASILRVHDVKEAAQAVKITSLINNG